MPETFDEDLGSGQLGLDTPNIARMYDYFLGGSAHTAADRAASDAIIREVPHVSEVLRFNRAFLARAVRVLVRRGIDQFIGDLVQQLQYGHSRIFLAASA